MTKKEFIENVASLVIAENEYRGNAFLLQIRNIFKTDILRLIFSMVAQWLQISISQWNKRSTGNTGSCVPCRAHVSLTLTDDSPVSYLQNVLLT